jgi:hypothetical protein
MKIYQVKLSKGALALMPPEERKLLLLLGHVNNELNVLSKLTIMSGEQESNKVVGLVQTGQTVILMRIHIGKLFEAWLLFSQRVLGNMLQMQKYLDKISEEAKKSRVEIQKQFGRNGQFADIRNKISFHYKDDNDLIEQNFQSLPESELWDFYLHKTKCNSFYWASELVVSHSMMNISSNVSHDYTVQEAGDRVTSAWKALCSDVKKASLHMTVLFDELIAQICIVHINEAQPGKCPLDVPHLIGYCFFNGLEGRPSWRRNSILRTRFTTTMTPRGSI